jgi:hypothetical protein
MCKAACFSSILILSWTCLLWAQSWQSTLVQMDASGKLIYAFDLDGNRIPDFSYAGYRNSEEDIPIITTVHTISAVAGDNTAHIQNAIDAVGSRDPDANGFRGALYLQAGEYEISGTLYLNQSGIVLRGAGDGSDPSSNTILKAIGNSPDKRSVLIAGGGSDTRWRDAVSNTTTNIVSDLVSVGSRSFEVADDTPFQVGDNIIIYHPCTSEWLQAVDYGGTHGDAGWAVDEEPLVFNRMIKSIQDNVITIDAPLFNHLNRSLAQSYIYKYGRDGLLTKIGIENLRIDIVTSGSTDENHAWNAIDLYELEDAWVINCTMLHFGYSGIRTDTATRITIDNCQALDPHSVIERGKRYNFQLLMASQLILFKDCHATNGRHHYVSNGASSVSGCVFYNCTSSGAYTSSEGHRRWSMGLLFDNHLELNGPRIPFFDPRLLGLYNRGDYGTGHGWASAHSVCWNCDVGAGDIAIQGPPTAQNYAIGCFGNRVTGGNRPWTCPFNEPPGHVEGTDRAGLEPASLFLAQLYDRLSESSVQTDPMVDTFSDGGFTANPVWTGDMDKWQIVIDSDVSIGASFSYTLRLNETVGVSGTKYLSTQRTGSWDLSQSWGVWMGRRLSSASDVNQSIIWLWANESDLTSPTVDGYRLRFGDNNADDAIVLQRVDDGNATDIISSSSALPNNLTDIGLLIRVTRTESSEWTLYTSVLPNQNGQGAIASVIPSAVNTPVYQGSYPDPTYTDFDDGYFGFMAVHASDIASRTAAEFDQLYFDTGSDASLPVELISFTAIGGNGEVKLNWFTASEIENIGFIILRGQEESGDYSELDSYKNNPQLWGAGNSSEEHSYHYNDDDVSNNVTYWYKLRDVDFYGIYSEYGPISAKPYDSRVEPERFYLDQNYPNPFNPRTMINYELPITNYIQISIYNLLGQRVTILLSEKQEAGYHQVEWDATGFTSGVYYYQLHTNTGFIQTKKLVLLK